MVNSRERILALSKIRGLGLRGWFSLLTQYTRFPSGVLFFGGNRHLKPILAKKHESENLISFCHNSRRLFLVISAMVCVRLRNEGILIGSDVDIMAKRFEEFADIMCKFSRPEESSVRAMIGLLDLPSRIEGEMASLGFNRVIFLDARDRCSLVRDNLRHFSGITGFTFVFKG